MLKHELLLADGTLLTSGPDAGAVSIRSVTLTEEVNDTTDLVPGAACAASVQLELWAPGNGPAIAPGAELTLSGGIPTPAPAGRWVSSGRSSPSRPAPTSAASPPTTA